jgi:hypothetical protein
MKLFCLRVLISFVKMKGFLFYVGERFIKLLELKPLRSLLATWKQLCCVLFCHYVVHSCSVFLLVYI